MCLDVDGRAQGAAARCTAAPPSCIMQPFHATDEVMRACLCGSSTTAAICVGHEHCAIRRGTGFEHECAAPPPPCGDDQNVMPVAGAACTCGVGSYPFPPAVALEPGAADRCAQAAQHYGRLQEMHPCDPLSAQICEAGEVCHLGSRVCYESVSQLPGQGGGDDDGGGSGSGDGGGVPPAPADILAEVCVCASAACAAACAPAVPCAGDPTLPNCAGYEPCAALHVMTPCEGGNTVERPETPSPTDAPDAPAPTPEPASEPAPAPAPSGQPTCEGQCGPS